MLWYRDSISQISKTEPDIYNDSVRVNLNASQAIKMLTSPNESPRGVNNDMPRHKMESYHPMPKVTFIKQPRNKNQRVKSLAESQFHEHMKRFENKKGKHQRF